jgi:hypothetical protein
MANSEYSVTFRDYSQELSRFRVNTVLLTAANFTAQMGLMGALLTALGGVTMGTPAKETRTAQSNTLSAGLPGSSEAQREKKWLVRSEDNVTHLIFRNEVPTADLSLLTGNSDTITDFTPTALAAFKSAWEAVVVSEDGNACTIRSMEYVGKRL